jgi:hypothetical protein
MSCSLKHQEKRRERAKVKAAELRRGRGSNGHYRILRLGDNDNPGIGDHPKTVNPILRSIRVIMDYRKPATPADKDNGWTGKNFKKAN